MVNHYSSKLVEKAVDELSKLPGIGKRTAMRLALHLLKQEISFSEQLGSSIINMRNNIRFCERCSNISDMEVCEICSNPRRDEKLLCIVEDVRDVMAIENTGQFQGLYHVLGGLISPMDGVSPSDLTIDKLTKRINKEEIEEIILALSATVEGDTTSFYIYKQLSGIKLKISTIARGVAIGDEIEFADEITLGRSIIARLPYATGF
ncbi:MAG: recombination mediator RecR [Bacteroidales bacterium]|jgi:recombination protein RecR|nr:recombination mediator RecR [Bacteroidales bacterium]